MGFLELPFLQKELRDGTKHSQGSLTEAACESIMLAFPRREVGRQGSSLPPSCSQEVQRPCRRGSLGSFPSLPCLFSLGQLKWSKPPRAGSGDRVGTVQSWDPGMGVGGALGAVLPSMEGQGGCEQCILSESQLHFPLGPDASVRCYENNTIMKT